MTNAPHIFADIHRDGGSAYVVIRRATFAADGSVNFETLESYDTLSQGASASARRAIAALARKAIALAEAAA